MTDSLRREWRSHAVSPWRWKRCTNQCGALGALVEGEAGGFFVSSDGCGGRRAYMKPRRLDGRPNTARAAREKIVSDLAFDLGINVPPVLLFRRDPCVPGEEQLVCASLVVYRTQWAWGVMKGYVDGSTDQDLSAMVSQTLPTAAARAFALDLWVDQPDHGDHPHNIIFGYDGPDDEGDFLFLDYAMSCGFGGRWSDGGWSGAAAPPFPPLMTDAMDRDELTAIAEKITDYDKAEIREIVQRIPNDFLSKDEGRYILDGLLGRQKLVAETVQAYLEGRP